MKHFNHFPLVTRAQGCYLELENGKKVLDAISSWWVTIHGHAHPVIADAIATQAHLLEQVIFTNFSHHPSEAFITRLLPFLPQGLSHAFFSDNGSTAVEVALKMAIQYWHNLGTPRRGILSFDGAYHGDTVGAMSLAARSAFTAPFEPLLFDVDFIPYPSTYIGDSNIEEKEQEALQQLNLLLEQHADHYAALIIEPLVQGVSGMRMCRPEFLKQVEHAVRAKGILLIYDEVMTGFGRTGELFACVKSQTCPDLLCLGKGITGGFLPLGLTMATDQIYQAFYSDDRKKTFFHGHSYTGNPISCAAAVASLELLLAHREAFTRLENRHLHYLSPLLGHPKIAFPRVTGTIAALDLKTKEDCGYFHPVRDQLMAFMLEKGIFLRPHGNTLYLLPPYCITDDELEKIYHAIFEFVDSAW